MTATAVLIVEDEKIIAKGIEKQLKAMGYAVAGSVSTGEEAVRRAVELRPDLVIMDISLGNGMDGVTAAGLIRKEVNVPVLFLTANSDDATLQRAKQTNPFGYVLKPYEDKDLQTAIEIGLYRHKIELQLLENERWLAATLGSIGDGVIATDERGRVRFLNALAEQLTGWTQADAFERDVRDIFHIVGETNRLPVVNPVFDALAKGEPVTLAPDTALIDKTGTERPIDDSAAPIRDVNGKMAGAVLVFRDITERRRLEEHLRQAQKMEAIGRLAGGIAHDFNNIMTVITGFSEVLLAEDQTGVDRTEALKNIHDAGKRAAVLTQQIMAFSRKQMLVPCVLNLNTVVRDMGAMVKRLIGSNIEFVTEVGPELGHVKADPTQIGQVILNLVVNARDAMPKGGRLVIATANAALGEQTARRHPEVKAGRYVLLTVTDTGSGIPDEVLAHIFEPFFTTKGIGQGTGLGLATVYGIVKQSNGHIEVASKVGEGTSFRVYLPLVEEPMPMIEIRDPRPAERGSETILVVEDDETVRRMVKMMLQKRGYKVLEAANGASAVAVAEQHRDTIHLLITDLIMPQLSGREVAERLTAIQPGLKVLFMSGYTADALIQQGVETAGAHFLNKPFNIAGLTQKVSEALASRS